jgi:hypothetical protein
MVVLTLSQAHRCLGGIARLPMLRVHNHKISMLVDALIVLCGIGQIAV